jgi:hypothetical protein
MHGATKAALIAAADDTAKRSGRNQVARAEGPHP